MLESRFRLIWLSCISHVFPCHACIASTCRIFCHSVRCIFLLSSVRCIFADRTLSWCEQRHVLLLLPDCRQGLLTSYLCLFSVSYSAYLLFLASLMLRCLCLDPIHMFTLLPWYATSPDPINLLFVYLVGLASRSACLGVDCEVLIHFWCLDGIV